MFEKVQRRFSRLFSAVVAVWLAVCVPVCAQQSQGGSSPGNATQPAQQTELATKGVSLSSSVLSPTQGLSTNTADLLRDSSHARVLNNLHMLKRGVWSSRGTGISKSNPSAFNSGASVLEISPWVDTTQDFLLFQCGDTIYKYQISTQASTALLTGQSTANQPCIRSYGTASTYYVNGTNAGPYVWDGVSGTMTAVAGWPTTVVGRTFQKPLYSEEFLGRQAFSGFTDYPSAVLLTQANSYESMTTSSSPVATDAGWLDMPGALGPVTGLRALRTTNDSTVLIVACQRGVAVISGTDSTNFAAKELTRQFGIPSNRTWFQVQNDLYFLANDGVRRFTTSSLAGLLNTQKGYLIQDLLNGLDRSKLGQAFSVYNSPKREAQIWVCNQGDSSPSHAIVLNFDTQDPNDSSSEYDTDPIYSTMDGVTLLSGTYLNGVSFVGTADGYLKQLFTGDDFDGTPIAWSYVSPLIPANSPAQGSSNKKWVIMTEGSDQAFTAEAYTVQIQGNGATKLQLNDTRVLASAGISSNNIGTWQSGTSTNYPKLINFDSRGSGRFWTIRLRGVNAGDHIDLTGIQTILTVGGLRE